MIPPMTPATGRETSFGLPNDVDAPLVVNIVVVVEATFVVVDETNVSAVARLAMKADRKLSTDADESTLGIDVDNARTVVLVNGSEMTEDPGIHE